MKKLIPIIALLAMLLIELILPFSRALGFFAYSLLIAGILLPLSSLEKMDDYFIFLITLAILPLMRIIQLFLNFSYFWNTLIFYLILFFLATFYIIRLRINPGFTKKNLILLPIMILLGIAIGFTGNLLFPLEKSLLILPLLPLISISEEFLFRGLIQSLSKKIYSPIFSILFTSALYSVFSLSLGIISIFLFFISIIMSLIYYTTGNIYHVIVLNLTITLLIFII